MAKRALLDPTASTPSPRLIRPPSTIPTSMKTRIKNLGDKILSSDTITEWRDLFSREVASKLPKQTHEHWALSLEMSEAANATLITERFVSRDRTGEPILAYFPQILPTNVIEKSHRSLEKWVEGYGPKPPRTTSAIQRTLIWRNCSKAGTGLFTLAPGTLRAIHTMILHITRHSHNQQYKVLTYIPIASGSSDAYHGVVNYIRCVQLQCLEPRAGDCQFLESSVACVKHCMHL
jgi:hypothetical protein